MNGVKVADVAGTNSTLPDPSLLKFLVMGFLHVHQ